MDNKARITHIAQSISFIWDVLTEDERQALLQCMTVKNYNKKDIVYSAGDTPTHLMYLIKGHVAIYGKGTGNFQQVIRMVEPGSIFAYREAFTTEDYETMAYAGSSTQIAFIPMELIFHLIWENHDISMLFIKEMARLLDLSVKRTITMSHKHIRGRMAEILLRLKVKYGVESDGITLAVYLSRQDMADISNMTTSNAIRTLSSFVEEGLLKVVGRKIQILDEERLYHISEMG